LYRLLLLLMMMMVWWHWHYNEKGRKQDTAAAVRTGRQQQPGYTATGKDGIRVLIRLVGISAHFVQTCSGIVDDTVEVAGGGTSQHPRFLVVVMQWWHG
jgi:hypothetical protein